VHSYYTRQKTPYPTIIPYTILPFFLYYCGTIWGEPTVKMGKELQNYNRD
jgi:hypothetical protein